MWHSHMQSNEPYKVQMHKVLGRVLNHIDDFPESTLKEHQEKTSRIKEAMLRSG